MGYRSDVAYTIRFVDDHDTNNRQSFYTFLAEAKSKPLYAYAMKEVEIDERKFRINYLAEGTKWYDGYAEVESHMALFGLAQEWCAQVNEGMLNCKIGTVFIRIGENTDDITE